MEQVIVGGLAVLFAPGSNFGVSRVRMRMGGHSEEAHMGDWYPTECLLSLSCKEGTERRG